MSFQHREQSVARVKTRAKAKTDNYNKLCKTLDTKLKKLCVEYNTKLYYISYRNGRYRGYNSVDETGQPWTPPTQRELDRMYPAPKIGSPSTPPVPKKTVREPTKDVEAPATSPTTDAASI